MVIQGDWNSSWYKIGVVASLNKLSVFTVNINLVNPLYPHPPFQVHLVAHPLLALRVSVVAARGDRDAGSAVGSGQGEELFTVGGVGGDFVSR